LTGLLIAERIAFVTSGGLDFQTSSVSVHGANIGLTAATYALSLATNISATGLIAYKAW
jgi:hypothetical protein